MSTCQQVAMRAVEELAARKKRAEARTELSRLRRKYLEETGEFFDPRSGDDDSDEFKELVKATAQREAANKALRTATSKLRTAIKNWEAPHD